MYSVSLEYFIVMLLKEGGGGRKRIDNMIASLREKHSMGKDTYIKKSRKNDFDIIKA